MCGKRDAWTVELQTLDIHSRHHGSPGQSNTFQKILISCDHLDSESPARHDESTNNHSCDRRPETLAADSRPATLEHHQWELRRAAARNLILTACSSRPSPSSHTSSFIMTISLRSRPARVLVLTLMSQGYLICIVVMVRGQKQTRRRDVALKGRGSSDHWGQNCRDIFN